MEEGCGGGEEEEGGKEEEGVKEGVKEGDVGWKGVSVRGGEKREDILFLGETDGENGKFLVEILVTYIQRSPSTINSK